MRDPFASQGKAWHEEVEASYHAVSDLKDICQQFVSGIDIQLDALAHWMSTSPHSGVFRAAPTYYSNRCPFQVQVRSEKFRYLDAKAIAHMLGLGIKSHAMNSSVAGRIA